MRRRILAALVPSALLSSVASAQQRRLVDVPANVPTARLLVQVRRRTGTDVFVADVELWGGAGSRVVEFRHGMNGEIQSAIEIRAVAERVRPGQSRRAAADQPTAFSIRVTGQQPRFAGQTCVRPAFSPAPVCQEAIDMVPIADPLAMTIRLRVGEAAELFSAASDVEVSLLRQSNTSI